jgi:hypothetical protein
VSERTSPRRVVVATIVLAALLGSRDAAAQTRGKFAAGGAITAKQPGDDDAQGSIGRALIWRLGQAKEGWNYKYGLSWFSTRLDRTIEDSSSGIGKLNVRPILGGYGYTHVFSQRTSVSASMLGGYAFTSFSLDQSARDRFRTALGDGPFKADAANTFVLKPEVSTWINLTEKIGLNINAGYILARPTVTIRTSGAQDRRRVNADMLMLKVGFVYSLF